MGIRINTNVALITAQRHLALITRRLETNFRRLATGKRINSSADDPAGYAISQGLVARIASLGKAKRNAEDGISLAQIAEGGLGSIADVLTHVRELAVQAGNGTLQPAERAALQADLALSVADIDRIVQSTAYSGLALLDGSHPFVTLQVGPGTHPGVDTYPVNLYSVLPAALGIASLNIGASGDPAAAIKALDGAIDSVSSRRAHFGATINTLNRTLESIDVEVENLSEANSRIVDVDLAAETADLTKNQILQEAAISVLTQGNAQAKIALRLLQAL